MFYGKNFLLVSHNPNKICIMETPTTFTKFSDKTSSKFDAHFLHYFYTYFFTESCSETHTVAKSFRLFIFPCSSTLRLICLTLLVHTSFLVQTSTKLQSHFMLSQGWWVEKSWKYFILGYDHQLSHHSFYSFIQTH